MVMLDVRGRGEEEGLELCTGQGLCLSDELEWGGI